MPAPVRTVAASLRVLLDGMIDYAGLFPPASLDMMTCVTKYSRYLNGPWRWALGRFVLPVARLDEFLNAQENAAASSPPASLRTLRRWKSSIGRLHAR